ncbi:MAG: TlpA family protein disulfide reductase [Nitrospirae bacterium]|nr:TlpA family protein disulfide reductase [Nitrospirota bacterium]
MIRLLTALAILLFISEASCLTTYASAAVAPDFTLTSLDNKTVSLRDFRGKVVVLNFWATTCGICREEMPSFNKLYLDYKDRGLVVLGVSIDTAEKALRFFSAKSGIAFPVLMDKERAVYSDKYKLFGIPVTLLIDKKGIIIERIIGEINWNEPEMKQKILRLLEAKQTKQ